MKEKKENAKQNSKRVKLVEKCQPMRDDQMAGVAEEFKNRNF